VFVVNIHKIVRSVIGFSTLQRNKIATSLAGFIFLSKTCYYSLRITWKFCAQKTLETMSSVYCAKFSSVV